MLQELQQMGYRALIEHPRIGSRPIGTGWRHARRIIPGPTTAIGIPELVGTPFEYVDRHVQHPGRPCASQAGLQSTPLAVLVDAMRRLSHRRSGHLLQTATTVEAASTTTCLTRCNHDP